jgi:hypothetical protein
MNEPDLIRVHETRVAHHVAPVRKIDCEHRSAAVLNGACSVFVKPFVVVRANVAARKDFFEVLEEGRVIRHHIFEVPVLLAVLNHQDFTVALDYLSLYFADSLIEQYFVRQLAVDDLLSNLRNALGAQGIGGTWPAQWRLRLLI